MKPRKTPTGREEHEIARRLRLRWENSTENLMREFDVSKSVIDRISRECKKSVPHETTASTVQSEGHTLAPCAHS